MFKLALWLVLLATCTCLCGCASHRSGLAVPRSSGIPHKDLQSDISTAVDQIYSSRKENLPKAIRFVEEILEKHPQSSEARYLLGEALAQAGAMDAARAEYERAAAMKGSNSSVARAAQGRVREGELIGKASGFHSTPEEDTRHAVRNMLPDANTPEQIAATVRYLEEVVAIAPKYPDARHALGMARKKAGDHRRALQDFRQAVAMVGPDHALARDAFTQMAEIEAAIARDSTWQNQKVRMMLLGTAVMGPLLVFLGFFLEWLIQAFPLGPICRRCKTRMALWQTSIAPSTPGATSFVPVPALAAQAASSTTSTGTTPHPVASAPPQPATGQLVRKWWRGEMVAVCPRCDQVPCHADGCAVQSRYALPRNYGYRVFNYGVKHDAALCSRHLHLAKRHLFRAQLARVLFVASAAFVVGPYLSPRLEWEHSPATWAIALAPGVAGLIVWLAKGPKIARKQDPAVPGGVGPAPFV